MEGGVPATTNTKTNTPTTPTNPSNGGMMGGRGRRRRSAKQGAWMAHVKATMRAHPGMKLKKVLPIAAQTYKKAMRGGGDDGVITPYPLDAPVVGGRRRRGRGSRKTRRGGKPLY